VADDGHRLEDRQQTEGLGQAAAGRGQDQLIPGAGQEIVERGVQGEPAAGLAEGPGHPGEIPAREPPQAVVIQADFRVQALG
jgi:hypothetical protein